MSRITTKELFDRYFESRAGTAAEKMRSQVDRQEVYDYEEKIGKQLVEMDVDELFEMIKSFQDTKRKTNFMIAHSSYDQISSLFRSIFNFYIDNYEIIKNPFYDKRMRGREALKVLAENREPLTWDYVQDIIGKLHRDFEQDKADYIECIIQLYYNGISKAEEIVNLKEDMIDTRSRKIRLQGRTTQILSKRCYELLVKVHNMTILEGWRGDYLMKEWRGGYFKYPIRPSQELEMNNRSEVDMTGFINRYIAVNVNNKYSTKLSYFSLFLLGFHDYVVRQVGEERAKELMTSYRSSEDAAELMALANEYGVNADNISHLKRSLRQFVNAEDID